MDWISLLAILLKVSVILGVVLGFVAYSVYAERRFSAIIQDRVGPNRTGIPLTLFGGKKDIPLSGLIQPMADGLKFILKEEFTPTHVRKWFFWLAPMMTMVPALITVAVIPFGSPLEIGERVIPLAISDLDLGPLFIFAIASLSVYGITLAGWSSNSKYPLVGGVRSSAQMISYEIALGLSIIPVLMAYGDLNLGRIVGDQSSNGWLLMPLWGERAPWHNGGDWTHITLLLPLGIAFLVFTTSIFAETNRLPFDLPECETELVGGYHTEYSSMKFALFFLGEYAAMIVGSALIVTLFFGGWALPFGLSELFPQGAWWASLLHVGTFLTKVTAFILFFILVRWSIPRFRYDQLMELGWVVFFEVALINVLLTALVIAAPTLGVGGTFIGLSVLGVFSLLMWTLAKSISGKKDNILEQVKN